MKRPTLAWVLFGLSTALVLGAMGWVSGKVLALETEGREVRRKAEREERIRLALWRMEAIASPRVADEQVRPYFGYKSFYSPDRAYTRLFSEVKPGEVLIPSSLLFEKSNHIRLHFQIRPDGRVESPQVPEGNMRDLAEGRYDLAEAIARAEARLEVLRKILAPYELGERLPSPASGALSHGVPWGEQKDVQELAAKGQQTLNRMEWQKRWSNYQNVQQMKQEQNPVSQKLAGPVVEGGVRPIWIEEELVLARRVRVGEEEYIQGSWFDRSELERDLLAEVTDLARGSRLEPVRDGAPDPSRQLASLPLRLVPGQVSTGLETEGSPLVLSLGVAWSAVLLAAVAFGFLLHGTLSLAERRAAFVSAVSHELRSPLTTLRMQSEMLAGGMIEDPRKREEVYRTLEAESNRLAHLVENVLSYARLERGRPAEKRQEVRIGALVERIQPRLTERAQQADMELMVRMDESVESQTLMLDLVAVEQILFNLLDNATKYANMATDRRIHLEIESGFEGRRVVFTVRDHGPGVMAREVGRLFRPFRKSAAEAAESAPGVGLGLSLARRLARAQGGELRYVDPGGPGASFVLDFPLES